MAWLLISECPLLSQRAGGAVAKVLQLRKSSGWIEYKCNKGYNLVGDSTSFCVKGQWTGRKPNCTAQGMASHFHSPHGRPLSARVSVYPSFHDEGCLSSYQLVSLFLLVFLKQIHVCYSDCCCDCFMCCARFHL